MQESKGKMAFVVLGMIICLPILILASMPVFDYIHQDRYSNTCSENNNLNSQTQCAVDTNSAIDASVNNNNNYSNTAIDLKIQQYNRIRQFANAILRLPLQDFEQREIVNAAECCDVETIKRYGRVAADRLYRQALEQENKIQSALIQLEMNMDKIHYQSDNIYDMQTMQQNLWQERTRAYNEAYQGIQDARATQECARKMQDIIAEFK